MNILIQLIDDAKLTSMANTYETLRTLDCLYTESGFPSTCSLNISRNRYVMLILTGRGIIRLAEMALLMKRAYSPTIGLFLE